MPQDADNRNSCSFPGIIEVVKNQKIGSIGRDTRYTALATPRGQIDWNLGDLSARDWHLADGCRFEEI